MARLLSTNIPGCQQTLETSRPSDTMATAVILKMEPREATDFLLLIAQPVALLLMN
jgi:undecaprenyl pyrophosphate phosphatase UppP